MYYLWWISCLISYVWTQSSGKEHEASNQYCAHCMWHQQKQSVTDRQTDGWMDRGRTKWSPLVPQKLQYEKFLLRAWFKSKCQCLIHHNTGSDWKRAKWYRCYMFVFKCIVTLPYLHHLQSIPASIPWQMCPVSDPRCLGSNFCGPATVDMAGGPSLDGPAPTCQTETDMIQWNFKRSNNKGPFNTEYRN